MATEKAIRTPEYGDLKKSNEWMDEVHAFCHDIGGNI